MLDRAERDGCGCPEWVVRCAHWGAQILAFSKVGGVPHNHVGDPAFTVSLGGKWDDGCSCHNIPLRFASRAFFNDFESAEAEFHRREQELVRS